MSHLAKILFGLNGRIGGIRGKSQPGRHFGCFAQVDVISSLTRYGADQRWARWIGDL